MTEIAIWPADAAGGNTLLIDGVANTPVLALPGDFADMGVQDLHAISGFAVYLGAFKRGASAILASKSLFDDFLQAALQQNDRLRYSLYFRKALGLDKGRTGKAFLNLKLSSAAGGNQEQGR
jgi:hypothetical protein